MAEQTDRDAFSEETIQKVQELLQQDLSKVDLLVQGSGWIEGVRNLEVWESGMRIDAQSDSTVIRRTALIGFRHKPKPKLFNIATLAVPETE